MEVGVASRERVQYVVTTSRCIKIFGFSLATNVSDLVETISCRAIAKSISLFKTSLSVRTYLENGFIDFKSVPRHEVRAGSWGKIVCMSEKNMEFLPIPPDNDIQQWWTKLGIWGKWGVAAKITGKIAIP